MKVDWGVGGGGGAGSDASEESEDVIRRVKGRQETGGGDDCYVVQKPETVTLFCVKEIWHFGSFGPFFFSKGSENLYGAFKK